MKLATTVMVRDEADIIGAMLDHHLAQGVDVIIVTDNGSVDGTTDILQGYADRGLIELRHDPTHRKQQAPVVTQMARDAASLHGADWVINADADEFFVPVDRSLTLHEVFEQLDPAIKAFLVPVTNLTGPAAASGSGLGRLTYRDERPEAALRATGLRAHPTADAIHVGDPQIDVIQGNHFVSLASQGAPPEALAIEVLHLPWRSWEQYRNKVEIAGRAYDDNPELSPSPNHHGMRDYRRLQAGALLPFYLLRHPDEAELAEGLAAGHFRRDDTLTGLASPVPDGEFEAEVLERFRSVAPALRDAEARSHASLVALDEQHRVALAEQQAAFDQQLADERQRAADEAAAVEQEFVRTRQELELTRVHVGSLEARLATLEGRPLVRVENKVRRVLTRART
ncbi:glycosyltransferase family 2 protein [Herbiconiux sp.]|uniref:glycosyltransferase family 2 protein n=1 Tax=Herbiconiux sp. TaxID=1871186 RepID=UPI0025BEE5F3|nr:glycosyltransferase family 2 protein [Herbiconiux sp.]